LEGQVKQKLEFGSPICPIPYIWNCRLGWIQAQTQSLSRF